MAHSLVGSGCMCPARSRERAGLCGLSVDRQAFEIPQLQTPIWKRVISIVSISIHRSVHISAGSQAITFSSGEHVARRPPEDAVPISLGLDYGHAGQNEITGGSRMVPLPLREAMAPVSAPKTSCSAPAVRAGNRKQADMRRHCSKSTRQQGTMNSRYRRFIGRVNWSAVSP